METKKKIIHRIVLGCMAALVAMAAVGCAEEVASSFSDRSKVEIAPVLVPMEGVTTRAADGLNDNTNSAGFSCLYAASATTTTSPNSLAKVMIDDNASNYTPYSYQVTGATALTVVGEAPTFPVGENSVNVYGWYPYTAANSFSIQTNQSTTTGYCLSDLMLADKVVCTRDASSVTPAPLAFRHVMSKVKIVLTPGTGVTVTAVALKNVKPTVAIDASTVTALTVGSASGAAGDVTLLSGGSLTSSSTAAERTLCGVFPAQTISSSFITVTAEIGGTPSTITYSFGAGSKTFVSAKEYTVNISVSATQTGSPTVSLADWTGAEGTVNIGSGGGDAPTLSPSSLTLTYGGSTGSITPTFTGATTFSGISSNTSIATVSGTSTLTVTPVAAGTCTIQVFPTNATTGFSSAACTVTVNKAAQTVGLSGTALTVGGVGNTGTFTVTRSGDGTITAESSNPSIATTSVNQGTGVVTVTNVAEGSATITVTVAEGTNHLAYTAADKTVAVTCNAINMVNNPLWRVAQYNMLANNSMATSHSIYSSGTTGTQVWNFNDAKGIGLSGYHQPTMKEQASIFPMDKTTGSGTNVWGLSETLASPKAFSEITCTVNGADVAASTSYIGKNASNDYYAVRFIGTNYASAWHYKWVTSPCAGLLIESYLISSSLSASEAQALLATLASSTIFTGAANAGTANQTPASTTVTTNGFVQRFLPACGCKNGCSGTADSGVGTLGYYWSSTPDSSNGFYWDFYSGGYLFVHSYSQSYGFSVRLFRD